MEGPIQIKRLHEQEDISDDDIQELGLQPSVADVADVDTQLPAEGDSTADPNDVMVLTLGDFLEKCREVDPLVCMGITSFIEKNQEVFGTEGSEDEEGPSLDGSPADVDDISFSKAISDEKPAPGQLDLSFPKA